MTNKIMKKNFFLISLLLICFNLFAQTTQVRIGLLNGPTCVPAAYMMENKKTISTERLDAELTYEKFADPQALLPKMIKKEIDVGFMPVNVAAKVYNSSNKTLLCCAVTGLGNLSLITTDASVRRLSDLKGKRVFVAGQGATPEYMMRYLLQENKLSFVSNNPEEDVALDFSIPTAQLAAQLISGKIQYAVVPEPFATIAKMKSASVRTAVDFQKEYLELTGEKDIYPLSVMVVRSDFAKDHPELLKAFLEEFEKSVNWTISNPSEAGKLAAKAGLGLSADVVEKSIPVSNYTYIASEKAIVQIEKLLNIFLNCDKTSIGGKLPDKGFYYKKD